MQETKKTSFHAYTSTAVALSYLLLLLLLLLLSPSKTKAAESTKSISLPGCPDSCGGVDIPYPFGIGPDCSMPGFEVSCNTTDNGTSTPYLGDTPVLNISLYSGQIRVNMPVSYLCYNSTNNSRTTFYWSDNLYDSPYRYNPDHNMFVVIGCSALGYLNFTNNQGYFYKGGCVSGCDSIESLTYGSCSGIGCCQTSIPQGTYSIDFSFDESFSNFENGRCVYAMLTEDEFRFNPSYITTEVLLNQSRPAWIDWAIANENCDTARTNRSTFVCISDKSVCVNPSSGLGYICDCSKGYQGNPYLKEGCQDIDECTNQNVDASYTSYGPCAKGGKCHNLQGSFECSCPFGWRDKQNMWKLHECERNWALIIGT